ncbi:hypothetical protein [Haloarcula marismortui]|uniref:GCN5-related N-acetyltransferase n=1 Tax=Haloarcula marismortui ATCC 33799 TaxID=662475 RepID=M0KKA6_9EURY|nr:hypothetical protein C435_06123 [Haloarcula californiae ATCC 33799]
MSCMGQTTLTGVDIASLRETYLRKVTETLPARARASGDWPIHRDHCFSRVVLDTVFEDEWYDHVNGRPAYEHLSVAELTRATDIADRMLAEGRPAVVELNNNSLRWRGKLE